MAYNKKNRKDNNITQVYNSKTKRYVARGENGKFIDVNEKPDTKFKGIKQE